MTAFEGGLSKRLKQTNSSKMLYEQGVSLVSKCKVKGSVASLYLPWSEFAKKKKSRWRDMKHLIKAKHSSSLLWFGILCQCESKSTHRGLFLNILHSSKTSSSSCTIYFFKQGIAWLETSWNKKTNQKKPVIYLYLIFWGGIEVYLWLNHIEFSIFMSENAYLGTYS